MERAEKSKVVEELDTIFADSGVVVVAHYTGLTVAQMSDFRNRMRQAGGSVRVAKSRLAKIALEGKSVQKMADFLKGQTVLAYSVDPVAAAKVARGFAKDNDKYVILGGAMGGQVLDPKGIELLASGILPSREELIAEIVGMIGSPGSNLIAAIAASGSDIAEILFALEARNVADKEEDRGIDLGTAQRDSAFIIKDAEGAVSNPSPEIPIDALLQLGDYLLEELEIVSDEDLTRSYSAEETKQVVNNLKSAALNALQQTPKTEKLD